jgi:hypothetical protein
MILSSRAIIKCMIIIFLNISIKHVIFDILSSIKQKIVAVSTENKQALETAK